MSEFCDSCFRKLVYEHLTKHDVDVLHAIYISLREFSMAEGLPVGKFSASFLGVSQQDLCRLTGLSRHFVGRSVTRLLGHKMITTRVDGRKTLHQLSLLGYRACQILFE